MFPACVPLTAAVSVAVTYKFLGSHLELGAHQSVLALVFLHSFPIPILLAEVHSLSTSVSVSRHGGYGTLKQLSGW